MSIDEYREKIKQRILVEAKDAYLLAYEKGVWNSIYKKFEFRWLYDKDNKEHLFEDICEFEKHCMKNL